MLDDVNLELPAGKVVAIVGENGAGKSTLVKLLAKMYEPTHGRILVDDTDLARIAALDWRGRLAGAFQDFFRFEFQARHTVGVGDLPRLDDRPAVETAVSRAGADDVIARLTAGLETQLGPTWPGGVEVSFGQWQKLALARGFMRDGPLVLVLDEPTAALDAETEHALFERYAAAVREDEGDRPHHHPGVTPLLDGADGRPDRRAGRGARRGDGHARGADGARRTVRPALRDSGQSVPVVHEFRSQADQGQRTGPNAGGDFRWWVADSYTVPIVRRPDGVPHAGGHRLPRRPAPPQ